MDRLVLDTLVAQEKHAITNDGRCGIPGPKVLALPKQFRTFLRPLFQQTLFFRDAVALWAAPLRPIVRAQLAAQEAGDEKRKKQFHRFEARAFALPGVPFTFKRITTSLRTRSFALPGYLIWKSKRFS